MAPLLLYKRAQHLREYMDDPNCDITTLYRTYKQFSKLNKVFSSWSFIYNSLLVPHLSQGKIRLLDIGCGSGDIVHRLANWAKRDAYDLDITAIDPDPRALAYCQTHSKSASITFRQAYAHDLIAKGQSFDVVISNHLLHHLAPKDLVRLCSESESLASKLVIHNDIHRSDLAYLGFGVVGPFFWRSFIPYDGLLSIRRSFTKQELLAIVPDTWQVRCIFPYRNLLMFHPLQRKK